MGEVMLDIEELDELLLDALSHLYDPDYEPPSEICALTLCDPAMGPTPVQSALMQAIRDLEPNADLPNEAHARRVHELILNRFKLKLTQEKTAELMGISVRHLNRVQREAVHTLLQRLWERRQAQLDARSTPDIETAGAPDRGDLQAPDWQAQARRELASLQASAPDANADVARTIDGALDLQSAQRASRGIEARVAFVQPGLVAATHPSVLRQMLITAMGRLMRFGHDEPISIFAGLENGNVRITISASLAGETIPGPGELTEGILAPDDASVEAVYEGSHLFLILRVPSARGKATVLVVDDNADMVHFFRRATVGTRYSIVHVETGEGLMETVSLVHPDAIVLDVMLPDVDGWQLLMQLHEDQNTRPIPVIVCSVVREEELALSLGAAHYIAKPVRPRQFIQALDRVMAQSPAAAPTAPERTESPS